MWGVSFCTGFPRGSDKVLGKRGKHCRFVFKAASFGFDGIAIAAGSFTQKMKIAFKIDAWCAMSSRVSNFAVTNFAEDRTVPSWLYRAARLWHDSASDHEQSIAYSTRTTLKGVSRGIMHSVRGSFSKIRTESLFSPFRSAGCNVRIRKFDWPS